MQQGNTTPGIIRNGGGGGGTNPYIVVGNPCNPCPPIPDWALGLLSDADVFKDQATVKHVVGEYLTLVGEIERQYESEVRKAEATAQKAKREADQQFLKKLLG